MESYNNIFAPSLDQKWHSVVSSQVVVGDLTFHKDFKDYKKEDYKISEVINKINHSRAEGKSICLFVGRTPYERLPADYNEAKDNEIWISSDFALTPSNTTRY